MDKVLVTGASGFIALHCIQQLLDQGYHVKGTVRSENKKIEVLDSMKNNSINSENLEIVFANLLKDEGWNEAVMDCKYVLHIASPFLLEQPNDEDDLIRPAVDGTLRVLNACKLNSIKKVVLTSSFAAIGYGNDEKIFDETDWSNINFPIGAYAKSKTLAEKAAWNFINELTDGNRFDFTVINPVAVTGPMLSNDIGTSNSIFLQLLNSKLKICRRMHLGFVDVRDVAKAHIVSMTEEKTNNERIILSEEEIFLSEMGKILKNAGYECPTMDVSNFLLKIFGIFTNKFSGIKKSIGKEVFTDKRKAQAFFDWKYISVEDSAVESAKQLESMGLISN